MKPELHVQLKVLSSFAVQVAFESQLSCSQGSNTTKIKADYQIYLKYRLPRITESDGVYQTFLWTEHCFLFQSVSYRNVLYRLR